MAELKERKFDGVAAPDWATTIARYGVRWYWEENINQPNGARFQALGASAIYTYDRGTVRGYGDYYTLPPIPQPDEELPPAPDSALYINDVDWGLMVRHYGDASLLISSGDPRNIHSGWTGVTVSADAALQLAHDIRRMAMTIKRKEKGRCNG